MRTTKENNSEDKWKGYYDSVLFVLATAFGYQKT